LSFLSNNRKSSVIFLDNKPSSYSISADSSIDVILSPSLYWYQRLELDISLKSEVKKLLPSLFEDMLIDSDSIEYSYYLYKESGIYHAFAYAKSSIIEQLKQNKIDVTQVSKIYFAQNEFGDNTNAIQICKECAIGIKNDVVIKLPLQFCDISKRADLNLEGIKLSKHGIKLSNLSSNSDDYRFFIYVVAIFISVYIFEYIQSSFYIYKLDEQKEIIHKKYSLASTSIQNESIRKRVSKENNTQQSYKEIVAISLRSRLASDEYIEDISIDNRVVTITYVLNNHNKSIEKEYKDRGYSVQSSFANSRLKVEIRL
jgi:hypothetical protein